MESNLNRHYKSLELDKILKLIAQHCPCEECAELALEIEPEHSLIMAQKLMQETTDAHMLIGRFGTPSFAGMHSIKGQLARAQAGGALNMRELLEIAGVLRCIRSLNSWRSNCEGVNTCLDERFSFLIPNKYLENTITTSIISEDEMSDSASGDLADIRRKMRAASSRVREQLDKMVRSPSYQKYLQEAIVTIRSDRFVVPVKAEHRNEVPGLVHDTSASGATVFIEPMGVVEANNQIKILKSKEAAEIERILFALSAEVASFADTIKRGYDIMLELGLIFAKARLAYDMKATTPIISGDGVIDLKKARHPLIDPKKVVATDIMLGDKFDTLVITGPNTGGKTVALKTLGLLTLMAMCGLMLPVSDNSKVSVFQEVLADIGDEQSIEQSLSTFSAHMTNIIKIIDIADKNSLVLLDELGAGTDPVEGAALAMAILEHLRAKGTKIAATTHYAELKAYALQTQGVENGSCEFDVATLRPTYRLLIGVPGRSNAFAISERLGLSHEVVDRAKELLSGESLRFEDVVQKLEESRQQMESRTEQAERLRKEAQIKSQQAQQAAERIKNECDREIERAKNQARIIIERTRAQANALLNELEEIKKQKNSEQFGQLASAAKSQLRSRMGKMEDIADPVGQKEDNSGYKLPRPLKKGDEVLIFDIDKKATVLSDPDKSGQVEVLAGIIKTRVPISNLRLINNKQDYSAFTTDNTKKTRTAPIRKTAENSLRMEKRLGRAEHSIDLRGKNSDEALHELDAFLDAAVLQGLQNITIIHGKGTGVLRNAVTQYLRKHPSIKNFRLGQYGEGETGVTICELK